MSMAIEKLAARVKVARPRIHRNLAMYPLLAPEAPGPDYTTLSAAMEAGSVELTEVSPEGSVTNLLLKNLSDRSLLILDGEEVVGAKQNRVINTTILVAAGAAISIPVTCVEEGRWHDVSPDFHSEKRMMYPEFRRRQVGNVLASMQMNQGPRGDQGEAWDNLRQKSRRMNAESATGAMADLFESYKDPIDGYLTALAPVAMQVGSAFAIGGRLAGLDCLSLHAAYEASHEMFVRSYALDAIDADNGSETEEAPAEGHVRSLVKRLSLAPFLRHPAVGLGESFRFSGPDLAAAALEEDGTVVHLCAFLGQGDAAPSGRGTGGMQRASLRRSRNIS